MGKSILYYCEVCHDPEVANVNLSSIEHHCKYRNPERHKTEILQRLPDKSTTTDPISSEYKE